MIYKNQTVNIGNKAKSLIWIKSLDVPTPDFEIIIIDNLIINYKKIIVNILEEFTNNNFTKIHEIIKTIEWNNEAVKNDIENLKKFIGKKVSFRTSAGMEDLKNHSFAGLYETFLNIEFSLDNYKKYIKACFKSLFSERVSNYLKTINFPIKNIEFSIIVQEMFDGCLSGVTFANYPIKNSRVVFSEGLGERVAQGENANEIIILPNKNIISHSLLGADLKKSFNDMLSYSEFIAYHKNAAQDIEWSLTEKTAVILQSRDITATYDSCQEQEIIFDSTNISESYPEQTTPLTYSFIKFAYAKVYENFLKLVGVKNSKINDKQIILENLLGYIKGRVYYKIENWYKMIEILPGYQYNKDFFESMLVPVKKLETESKKERSNLPIYFLFNFPIIFNFIQKLLFYKKINRRFILNFENKYNKHKTINLNLWNGNKIIEYFKFSEKNYFDDWKIPILNDFRVMIFHGILKKIIFSNIKIDPQFYLNEIISNFYKKDDLQLISEVQELATEIKTDQELSALFENIDNKQIYGNLLINNSEKIINFKSKIDAYFNKYSDRRPDELKLESLSINEQPEFFIMLLKCYREVKFTLKNQDKKDSLFELQKIIKTENSLLKSYILNLLTNFIAKYTRDAIKNREIFRFKRSQVYGVARDCFMALAEKMVTAKVIDQKNDIYYLTKEEIFAIFQNDCLEETYHNLIKKRKETFLNYNAFNNLPKRLRKIGIGNNAQLISDIDTQEIKNSYSGLATSKGIVRAEVVVLKKFDSTADFKDKILVTYQTDPGWTIIFPLIKGVVLEKGNTLSHAAILSRELDIPSVVKVEGIVNLLKNGDIVEIDGNQGLIKLIKS
ncbi:MAG: PEP/pyruvate-binding domain-containing protein [bacterium]|nr:PEP/pyruvate-binding domain-containing protein [bacterium]